MKSFWRKLAYFFLGFVGFIILLAFLAIDFSPEVEVSSAQQVDEADSINALFSDTRNILKASRKSHDLVVTQDQANSLAGFIQRAHPKASAEFNYQAEAISIAASYKLSERLGGLYLNVKTQVNQGLGVNIDHIWLGDLYLPSNFGLWLAELLANTYTSSHVATTAIETIQGLKVEGEKALIGVNPIYSLLVELKQVDTGMDIRSQDLRMRVVSHLKMLDALPANPSPSKSLNYYLVEAMKHAQNRSLSARSERSREELAALENEAAIMALAIFAGHRRFASAVGGVAGEMGEIPSLGESTNLNGRGDLSLHFIFSAAIKLMSEKGFSIAVGEFKELMDRGQGGSGYSFIDLSADLAGAHFATRAVDPQHALFVQQMTIAFNNETAYFPPVDNLDEGLSKQEFVNKYSNVDSPEYKHALEIIQKRIDALPISQ